jgi:hypothetical protein
VEFDIAKTTTERQLVVALAASGRIVSLMDVANWRKNGLLPPLASHGLGPGKGKTYRWHEKNIVPRAATIFDALKKQGRTDHAILILFLSGFDVPPSTLRRVWTSRARLRKPLAIKLAANTRRTPGLDINALLLLPVLAVGAAIHSKEKSAIPVHAIERFLIRLGHNRRGAAEQLYQILTIVIAVLETSTLVREASNSQLREAQRYIVRAINFLDAEMGFRGQLVECLGPSLFVLILALVCSGQNAALESIAARIDDVDRPAPAGPVHAFRTATQGLHAAG